MLWRGISIEPQWVVLSLLLVAVALGRGRAFLTDWLPFLVLFFAYEIMRGFAAKGGFAPHEVASASAAGARLITLGPRVLRSDTASPLAAALVLYELGDLSSWRRDDARSRS